MTNLVQFAVCGFHSSLHDISATIVVNYLMVGDFIFFLL